MADIFVDTAGWVAHVDSAQPQHAAASTLIGVCLAEGGRLLSSNYVLIEFVALMTSRQRVPRDALIASVDALLAWEHLTLVHIDPPLHAAAWACCGHVPTNSGA